MLDNHYYWQCVHCNIIFKMEKGGGLQFMSNTFLVTTLMSQNKPRYCQRFTQYFVNN